MHEVSTTQYEASHGRRPRGSGSWGFFFDGDEENPWWAPSGFTYSTAKKKAVREAKARGVAHVAVAP